MLPINWDAEDRFSVLTCSGWLLRSRGDIFGFLRDALQLEQITPARLNFRVLTRGPVADVWSIGWLWKEIFTVSLYILGVECWSCFRQQHRRRKLEIYDADPSRSYSGSEQSAGPS